MATRLERLFLLLDSGSNAATRKAAAEQIGEIQKAHPHELVNLLGKTNTYLKSSNWDTRVAAGQAVEAICSNCPPWEPDRDGKCIKHENEEEAETLTSGDITEGMLRLGDFDIEKVLERGRPLLGSAGSDYDELMFEGENAKERLAKQRKYVLATIGLNPNVVSDFGDIVVDEDLIQEKKKDEADEKLKQAVEDLITDGMSVRERHAAKRKAKQQLKQSKRKLSKQDSSVELIKPKMMKAEEGKSLVTDQPESSKVMVETGYEQVEQSPLEWPFQGFCEVLSTNLLSPVWEIRHGAALGLREVLKYHAESAGVSIDCPGHLRNFQHEVWIEDLALRIVTVFALDRFGDFVSDQVVAPVREVCAQLMAVLLKHMETQLMEHVFKLLLKLQSVSQWESRHGGLLGIKYVLAVRSDLAPVFANRVVDYLCNGLEDLEDDVRAVAADCLIPLSGYLSRNANENTRNVLAKLWDCLLELDDLTPSTSCVITALAQLLSDVSRNEVAKKWLLDLSPLVPRLFPFFRHILKSVRMSSLQTFGRLLSDTPPEADWVDNLCEEGLKNLFFAVYCEKEPQIRAEAVSSARVLAQRADKHHLSTCFARRCKNWFNACCCQQGEAMEIYPTFGISIGGENKVTHVRFGNQPQSVPTDVRMVNGILVDCAKFLANICVALPDGTNGNGSIADAILSSLNSISSSKIHFSNLIVLEWVSNEKRCGKNSGANLSKILGKIEELLCAKLFYEFEELKTVYGRLQGDCVGLVKDLKELGLGEAELGRYVESTRFDSRVANELVNEFYPTIFQSARIGPNESLESKRNRVLGVLGYISAEESRQNIQITAGFACCIVSFEQLPSSINPVVKPLLEAIKKEEDPLLQALSATALAKLLKLCSHKPKTSPKILEKLFKFTYGEGTEVPNITEIINCGSNVHRGIWTLKLMQETEEKSAPVTLKGRSKAAKEVEVPLSEEEKALSVRSRGGREAIKAIATVFGGEILDKLQYLWNFVSQNLVLLPIAFNEQNCNLENAQELINSFHILGLVVSVTDSCVSSRLLELVPPLLKCVTHPYVLVRYMAAKCICCFGDKYTSDVMALLIKCILPFLNETEHVSHREGASEMLYMIVESLGLKIVPYVAFFVVRLMGCMSDNDENVRAMCTLSFASVIKVMPLEGSNSLPDGFDEELLAQKRDEKDFLEQLLNPSKLKDFKIPVRIKAEIRSYQQEGVNWLWFLNKFKLHGILCDDMGLGKTLQTICILSSDEFLRRKRFSETGDKDCSPLPSIVVCPTTIIGHWYHEIKKFCDNLKPVEYSGPPPERKSIQVKIASYNVIIVSYEVVRNDIDFFSSLNYNYCVLDEGHIIKNGKSKVAVAIKQINANHRLILSGTPIQNNVLELWSLFDFVMPGFLGTEKQFNAKYGRPIRASRNPKTPKDQEAGVLAMESLHKQVLPFLLRRMKEDVLKDLPPKIIQDYYCDLSPLQVKLHEDFAKSHLQRGISDTLKGSEKHKAVLKPATHIFQALQYLRKLINHPALVLTPKHPQYKALTRELNKKKQKVTDIEHAPKLIALRDLLHECGIGVQDADVNATAGPINQHRALIFCQLKAMLDIVEFDLFKKNMPSVNYFRMDGTTDAKARHEMVTKFNEDPTVDVLLLTTSVGGLGLNLTGADTVIFVEHDWNPMKDLQAMDRAHRIGQKKVVNVYRLIAKGSLEEKVMGLQKFKLTIANTVISKENAGLKSMDTDQVLDLFNLSVSGSDEKDNKKADPSKPATGMKDVVENLEELWDESQYDEFNNLDGFIEQLDGK
eukprot:Nk52_evm41s1444 gene=Nk52_evmTU41s1444